MGHLCKAPRPSNPRIAFRRAPVLDGYDFDPNPVQLRHS